MSLLWQGLLLGLSTGVFCLGACAPAVVPALLVGGGSWRAGAAIIGQVAAGRLAAYLLFGATTGALGSLVVPSLTLSRVEGLATCLLALLLAWYVAGGGPLPMPARLCRLAPLRAVRAPLAFGFLTGLSLCPPFLLAITTALGAGGPAGGMLFFLSFFAGTSVYLVPLLPLGALGGRETPRLVGRMAGMLSAGAFAALGLGRLLT